MRLHHSFACSVWLVLGVFTSLDVHSKEEQEKAAELAARFAQLPEALKADVQVRFPGSIVLKIDKRRSYNPLLALYMWDIYQPSYSYEVQLRNALNDRIKAMYSLEGKIESTSTYKVPFADLPPHAIAALKQWAPNATWDEPAEVKKGHSEVTRIKIKCRLNGKKYCAEIQEEGAFIEKDEIPITNHEK